MPEEETVTASRIGRPARIDHDDIARAVLEIGFDDATIKTVAAHLGVSVPGLYYYVRGKDDLLRVAAEYSLARTKLPVHHGQHWAQWLREWGWYIRTVMAANPTLMQHYLAGGLSDERVYESIGTVLEVLTDAGFSADEAMAAWGVVGSVAVGSAVDAIRLDTDAELSWEARLRAVLEQHDPDELTALRSLLDEPTRTGRDAEFELRLTTVLVGIAVRNELPLDDEVTGTTGTRTGRRSSSRTKKRTAVTKRTAKRASSRPA